MLFISLIRQINSFFRLTDPDNPDKMSRLFYGKNKKRLPFLKQYAGLTPESTDFILFIG